MRFKVDENLPVESADILRQVGFDADTVHFENLTGANDTTIAEICKREERALVTLDLGFADIRNYPPSDYAGLIVLRLSRQDKLHTLGVIQKIAKIIGGEEISGKLWIVEERRIRIRG